VASEAIGRGFESLRARQFFQYDLSPPVIHRGGIHCFGAVSGVGHWYALLGSLGSFSAISALSSLFFSAALGCAPIDCFRKGLWINRLRLVRGESFIAINNAKLFLKPPTHDISQSQPTYL
jgi:hypothetical protein